MTRRHAWGGLAIAILLGGVGCASGPGRPPASLLVGAAVEHRDGHLILHVTGDAFQRGYQHGALLRREVRGAVQHVFDYLSRETGVPLLGRWYVHWILDRAAGRMAPFVPPDVREEMRGLALGAGLPLNTVHRIHAIPDLFPTLCSSFAAFGPATANGRLIHTRNLDWNIKMGIQDRPLILVVRPAGKHPYVNLGYVGFVGVLSGMNARGISVAQVGSESVDQTIRGTPMPFLLRRILEDASTVDEAVALLTEARRTVGYNYVIADAAGRTARAVETTAHHLSVFLPDDPREHTVPYALPIPSVVVRADTAMDATIRDLQLASRGDPTRPGLEAPDGAKAYDIRYKRHGELIRQHHGRLDPALAIQIAQAVAPPSNLQSVVYAFPEFWIANATGRTPAAQTPYAHFDLRELLER